MFRYFAIIWNESDAAQVRTAHLILSRLKASPEWSNALTSRGIQVFCAGIREGSSEICLLHGGAGAILGTVFEGNNEDGVGRRVTSIGHADTERMISGACTYLVDAYWGRYVAFISDTQGHRIWVLRDPLGGLPCLMTSFRGVQIFASLTEDLLTFGGLNASINWSFINERVRVSMVQRPDTAINEVAELSPGECLQFSAGTSSRRKLWDPYAVARHPHDMDLKETAKLLRRTAKSCVQSWASCYRTILHKLSGGLDSSIVLACLQNPTQREAVTCVNYYSFGSDSDERSYARAAAQHLGYEVIEQERDASVNLEDMLRISLSCAPTFYMGAARGADCEALLAKRFGSQAVSSGGGGDQLFYQHRVELVAADYAHRHGLQPRLFPVALEAAYAANQSVWSVIGAALSRNRRRRPWMQSPDAMLNRTLVSRDLFVKALEFSVGHHDAPDHGLPPGKSWHAYTLAFSQQFYDPAAEPNDPEPVTPLISQPLVELCLKTPTYILAGGGWDRAAARLAFEADLPQSIVRRRTKGGMEENAKEILVRNIGFVREMLLDGILAREGLLDRQKLEEVLSCRPTFIQASMAEIFDHLSVEVWLQTWVGQRHRRQTSQMQQNATVTG